LLDVWPQILHEHRPEWKATTAAPEKRGLNGPIEPPAAKHRDAFLLLYLNLEDLSGPRSLLIMVNARARNAPDVFAYSGYQSARLGVETNSINLQMIDGPDHRMRMIGYTTAETYGVLYALRAGASQGAGDVSPDVGLVILEAQGRLLDFSVK
jgi:hypothetical protein